MASVATSMVMKTMGAPSPSERTKEAAVYLGLGVGGVASICAVALDAVVLSGSPAAAVFVMAGVCVANIPYTAYKEHHITKLPGLRQLNNSLMGDAQRLESAVDVLGQEIDELKPEAERAAGVRGQLDKISAEQGRNVDALVQLCKENARTIAEMKDHMRERIVQDVLKIVLSSDRDNDGVFSKQETKMLFLKINMQLQEDGVQLDQEKFLKVMSKNPTVAQTIKIVQHLIPSLNEGDDDGVETNPEEEDDFDMFRATGDGAPSPGVVGGGPALGSLGRRGGAGARRSGLVSQKTFHNKGHLPAVV